MGKELVAEEHISRLLVGGGEGESKLSGGGGGGIRLMGGLGWLGWGGGGGGYNIVISAY